MHLPQRLCYKISLKNLIFPGEKQQVTVRAFHAHTVTCRVEKEEHVISELKGAAKRIFGGLQNRLSKLARFGQSKHEAKQAAREAYIKEHETLAGYNPAKVDGIFSLGTAETCRAAMQPFAK